MHFALNLVGPRDDARCCSSHTGFIFFRSFHRYTSLAADLSFAAMAVGVEAQHSELRVRVEDFGSIRMLYGRLLLRGHQSESEHRHTLE